MYMNLSTHMIRVHLIQVFHLVLQVTIFITFLLCYMKWSNYDRFTDNSNKFVQL